MTDGFNAPSGPDGPPEEVLRRPMGGFSPSSPDYRPLPPLNLPQLSVPQRNVPSTPAAPPARPSAPPPPLVAGPQTWPDGVPTPGRIPAYPAQRAYPTHPAYGGTQPGPAYPTRPLGSRPLGAPGQPPPMPYRQPAGSRPDMTAVIIEALSAVFGLFGLGWMMAGRTSTGVLLVLGGLLWDGIVIAGTHVTLGVGACCFIPLHVVFVVLSTVLLSNYIKSLP